jgi:hypothetical protein
VQVQENVGCHPEVVSECAGDQQRKNNRKPVLYLNSRRTHAVNPQLKASSFDDFFAVMDKVRAQLPVVTNEIGDTWIHGIASDAFKTAAMRALMRAHGRTVSTPSSSSSPSSSSPSSSSPSSSSPPPQALSHPHVLPDGFAEFERLLLKCPEHTWGGDQKMFLHYGQGGDYFNWSNSQFRASSAEGEFDVRSSKFNTGFLI